MTEQLSIDDMKLHLIDAIQTKSKSQVETWKRLPYYAWLSWGLSGYSETEYYMFNDKLLRLAIFDRNSSYTIAISLNTGEVVRYDGKPLVRTDSRFVLQIMDGDLDAAGYIQRLSDHIAKHDVAEKKLGLITASRSYEFDIPDVN